MGKPSGMLGKHHSEETKKKIGKAGKGRKLPPRSEEYKQKISATLKGRTKSEEFKRKVSKGMKGKNTWMTGRKLPFEVKKKISMSNKDRKFSEKHKQNISIARKGMKFSKEHLLNMSKARRGMLTGPSHWNWKGGQSMTIRKSIEYKDWRLAVFAKDDFTCVGCGDNRGRNLQAHHILSFAEHPNLRFDVSNGTTLCKKCHAKLHPELKNYILSRA